MKKCQSEDERLRQKRLQEERMRESARKLEEELERQRTQLAKKALKEQKRKELASKRQVRHGGDEDDDVVQDDESGSAGSDVTLKGKGETKRQTAKKDGGMSFCGFLFSMIFFLIVSLSFLVVGLYYYCSSSEVNSKTHVCHEGRHYGDLAQRHAVDTWVTVKNLAEDLKKRISARLG
jgi:hypothetical protein